MLHRSQTKRHLISFGFVTIPRNADPLLGIMPAQTRAKLSCSSWALGLAQCGPRCREFHPFHRRCREQPVRRLGFVRRRVHRCVARQVNPGPAHAERGYQNDSIGGPLQPRKRVSGAWRLLSTCCLIGHATAISLSARDRFTIAGRGSASGIPEEGLQADPRFRPVAFLHDHGQRAFRRFGWAAHPVFARDPLHG